MIDVTKNNSIQVIAVDDEIDAKVLYEYFFQKEIDEGKIRLKFITDPADTLNILKEDSVKTLILCDINMPKMSGLELLEQIKSQFPEVIVIMVSAYVADEIWEQCKALGAEDYLEKPVDFENLKNKILTQYSFEN